METLPLVQQYAILQSQGLMPLSSALALCRANRTNLSMVVRWLSTNHPEQCILEKRWCNYSQEENKDYVCRVGVVDEGCYIYHSLLGRPLNTVFIKWRKIRSIFLQDGLDLWSVALYAPGKYGGKFIQAQSDMDGFAPFLESVSQRFFGRGDYLKSKFKLGAHPVRKFQVWPKEREATDIGEV